MVRAEHPLPDGKGLLVQGERLGCPARVASVLAMAIIPRDFRLAECLTHRTVQAIPDGHLIPVRATAVPEPLNINRNDRPVNGRASTRHTPSRKDQ